MEASYKVVEKGGKFFLRMHHSYYDYCGGYVDCMIYGANTDSPYIKYMSNFLGKLPLDDSMKADLAQVKAAKDLKQ